MTRSEAALCLFLVAYFVAANLTGANYANHRCDRNHHADCGMGSVLVGAFFPIYWSGRFALEVTR